MYDKPHDVVNRVINNKALSDYLNITSNKIDLLINFGSWLFMWCSKDERLSNEDKIVCLVILRRALEIIDSISILVKHSSIDVCKVLLRSLIELLFEFEYLVKEDSTRRSKCYIVWYMNQMIELKKSLDPESKEGQRFYAAVKSDKYMHNFNPKKPATLDIEIENISEFLEEHKEINEEYRKTQTESKRNFPWYAMYDGPNNAFELSKQIQLNGFYEYLFRHLSKTTHNTDLFQGVLNESKVENQIGVIQIRSPMDLNFVMTYTITFTLGLYNIVIDHFFPKSLYARQQLQMIYDKEIRDFYFRKIQIKF